MRECTVDRTIRKCLHLDQDGDVSISKSENFLDNDDVGTVKAREYWNNGNVDMTRTQNYLQDETKKREANFLDRFAYFSLRVLPPKEYSAFLAVLQPRPELE